MNPCTCVINECVAHMHTAVFRVAGKRELKTMKYRHPSIFMKITSVIQDMKGNLARIISSKNIDISRRYELNSNLRDITIQGNKTGPGSV